MAIPNSRENARQLVEQIAKDHGYLGKEELQEIKPDLRRKIEEAFLKKDLMIGSSVIALAKNLYTSKARFVFELLQNCDDNNYTKAAAAGTAPFVSFSVHPRRIILECNEDGFNRDNLIAICSVGQSSKTGAQGYIGEKGIGFKSVFMAAWKVHIESGSFSFSFSHRDGESGMGMISPMWETFDDGLGPSLTRITLHLTDSGDSGILERTRRSILKQFEQLQETILLFMKNLRTINVRFFDDNGQQTASTKYSVERPQANFAVVKRSNSIANGNTEDRVKCFHVTTHQATNLAKNENRTYSEREDAMRAYSESQVVLAFPLTEEFVPIIEPQDLFVFLPVRPVGFSFLIQADFVTDASRQDIVGDSVRNHGLIEHVAEAFIKAALQFCDHDTLRYQWMRFLPDRKNPNWNSLWRSLVNNIAERLASTPLIYERRLPTFGSRFRLIKDLVRLPPDYLDEVEQPLFDDQGQVISDHYASGDIEILMSYGLESASFTHIYTWLKADLQRGERSRMRSPRTSEGWHIRCANVLRIPFRNDWQGWASMLKGLDLLPLDGGSWVTSSTGAVYFHTLNGLTIPADINLRLITPEIDNPVRIALFHDLGVQTASVQLVRTRILQQYSTLLFGGVTGAKSFEASKRHLEFLYLTEHLRADEEPPYSRILIYNNEGTMFCPHEVYNYVANNEPYGALELFRKTDSGPNPGDGAPGHAVHFVKEKYFMDAPSPPAGQEFSWLEWFHKKLRVDDHVVFSLNALDERAQYLQKHRPEKFLAALCERYRHSPRSVTQDFVRAMQETEVLCRGNRQVKLKATYFPTEELEGRVKHFLGEDTAFPWLRVDDGATHETIPGHWKGFLRRLGVGIPASDVRFGLDMLICLKEAFPDTVPSEKLGNLFKLYEHIETRQGDGEDEVKSTRDVFDNEYVYIPSGSDHYEGWYEPDSCVWSAAKDLRTKVVLQRRYEPFLQDARGHNALLTRFFKNTLGIKDCTHVQYMEELKELNQEDCDDSDEITGVYEALQGLLPFLEEREKQALKTGFESDARIAIPTDGYPDWRKVSECVWSDAARLRGLVSLNDYYPNLEALFVGCLGVKRVNLEMAIDELKEAGSAANASVSALKSSIWTVNSLLPTVSNPPDSADTIKCRIFPIKRPDGSSACVSNVTEFLVADRDRLRKTFESKVKFLDFTLEECARLRPFIDWTGLETRNLSLCVTEVTTFQDGRARPTRNPERQIANRAHPLLRVAATFNSPRTQTSRGLESLYDVLRSAEIMETDGISSDLHLSQDGTCHVIKGEVTTLHIDDDDGHLKIYVPRNRDEQEYMVSRVLGERLFKWMMTDPDSHAVGVILSKDGISATKDIMITPRSQLARALEDNGIASISVENLDEEVSAEPGPPSTPSTTATERVFDFADSSIPGGNEREVVDFIDTPPSSVGSPEWSRHRVDVASGSGFFTPSRPPLFSRNHLELPVPRAPTTDTEYVALLGAVISSARGRNIPVHGTLGMEDLSASLGAAMGGPSYTVRGTVPWERECKIGAAGELFVFELLSHAHNGQPLPNYTRDNWQSTMRKHCTVHPEYADMEPWTGSETSDITYSDSQSVLTEILIDQGYLARDEWEGRTPFYYIEVKTTTLSCETPFYMSKNQFQRMKRCKITPDNRNTIYTVFRVYNLGQGRMGLKIYVDPESLRLNGELEFAPDGSWLVTPAAGV